MIDIERLIDALTDLMSGRGYTITADGTEPMMPRRALAPDCLLPVLVRLAEEKWRTDAGAVSFGLAIDPDDRAFCGHTLRAVHHAPVAILVLCVDQVLGTVADEEGVITLDALQAYAAAP